jgi:MFS transporter, FHS family, Na+ dependent glucose transporter 1
MAQAAGYILGSLVGGQMFDRLPGHPVLGVALVAIGGLLWMAPLMGSVALLAMVFLALGLFQGALDVGGNTLIGWLYGSRVGPYMNGLHFFFGLGAFAAPLVAAVTMSLSADGVLWTYRSLGALIVAASLLLIALPSPTATYTPTAADAGAPRGMPLIIWVILFFFLYVGAEKTFSGWVYSYATIQQAAIPGSSIITAAYLNSAFWGAYTVGRLAAIPLAKRFRPRTILLTDLLAAAGSLSVILLWPGSWLALWVGVIGFGLALASIFPTTLTWAGRRVRLTGRITSFFFVGGSTGAMVFPWLTGQFFDRFGPSAAIWTVATIVSALLATFFVVMRRGSAPAAASAGQPVGAVANKTTEGL